MTSIFFSETNNKTKKNGKWQANPKTITYEGIFVLSLLFSLRLLYDSCFAPWLVSFYCHVMLDDCCFVGVVCRQYSLLVFSFYFLPDCWLDSDGISNNKLANSAFQILSNTAYSENGLYYYNDYYNFSFYKQSGNSGSFFVLISSLHASKKNWCSCLNSPS